MKLVIDQLDPLMSQAAAKQLFPPPTLPQGHALPPQVRRLAPARSSSPVVVEGSPSFGDHDAAPRRIMALQVQ